MCPNSFVSFIDWLDSKKGHVMFFVSSLFPLGWAFRLLLYTSYILGDFFLFLRLPFIYILYDLTYQKKEFTLI